MSNGIGGNLFSSALSAIGGIFGGPIGAMIGQMFSQIASQVIQQVLGEIGQQFGLSQQNVSDAQNAFQSASGTQLQSAGSYQDTMQSIRDSATPEQYRDLQDSMQMLRDNVKDAFNKSMNEVAQGGGLDGGKRKKGDFFTAMAEALGLALQAQANKVEALSNDLADAVNKSDSISSDDRDAKSQADNQIMLLQTQVSSESARLNFMATGIQTALSKIGDALTTLGRAQ